MRTPDELITRRAINDHGAGHQIQAVGANVGHDLLTAPAGAPGSAAQQTAPADPLSADPLSSDGHGALVLCLVMLVGLGLMLLTALKGRSRAVALAPRLGLDGRPRPGRRLRAPPLLSELSILRC